MRLKMSNVIWGLIFILVGVGFAGNAFGLWDFNLFFRGWWTLFIIVPCAMSLIKNGYNTGAVVGLGIGVMFFLSATSLFDTRVVGKLILPVIFVLIGVNLIFKNVFHRERNRIGVDYQGGDAEYSAVFSGGQYKFAGERFMGTTINAVFGGIDLDLRDAIIEEDVVINATAIFGGIDILVPSNVKVKVSNVPIFGGVDNKASYSSDPMAPTIYLNSTCMFGGIDIK